MKTYIKENEGYRSKPYKCTAGKTTIGWGRNLSDKGISEYEATIMLDSDINDASADLRRVFDYEDFETLSFNRKMALTDWMFNCGLRVAYTFKKFIAAIKAKDWEEAALQLKDSNYYNQVTSRAEKNMDLIRKG